MWHILDTPPDKSLIEDLERLQLSEEKTESKAEYADFTEEDVWEIQKYARSTRNELEACRLGCNHSFTLASFNPMGKTSKGRAAFRKQVLKHLLESVKPDLLFLQELPWASILVQIPTAARAGYEVGLPSPTPPQSLSAAASSPSSKGPVEAGILYRREEFTPLMVDLSLIEIKVEAAAGKVVDRMTTLRNRMAVLKLTHDASGVSFIAISFHNVKRVDSARQVVYAFFEFTRLLYRQEKLPIVVGGDFNFDIAELDVEGIIPSYAALPGRTRLIDYFYFLSPRRVQNDDGGTPAELVSKVDSLLSLHDVQCVDHRSQRHVEDFRVSPELQAAGIHSRHQSEEMVELLKEEIEATAIVNDVSNHFPLLATMSLFLVPRTAQPQSTVEL